MKKIEQLIREAVEKGASDLHLAPEALVLYRIDGQLFPASEEALTASEFEEFLTGILTGSRREKLLKKGELDFVHSLDGGNRVRFHVFRQRGTYAVSLRLHAAFIPDVNRIFIPRFLLDLTKRKHGLVIAAGMAGSGKTTTIASLIQHLADASPKTVVTIENPMEYVYTNGQSMVLQREVGVDTPGGAAGILAAVREDADIISVGEISDGRMLREAMTAAETGHLVFGAFRANSVKSVLLHIEDLFGDSLCRAREQLSDVLEGIFVQRLLPREGGGRVAAFEVLTVSEEVRDFIRDGANGQILSQMQKGKKHGMQTMDDAIYDLYMKSMISRESAAAYALNQSEMSRKITLF